MFFVSYLGTAGIILESKDKPCDLLFCWAISRKGKKHRPPKREKSKKKKNLSVNKKYRESIQNSNFKF